VLVGEVVVFESRSSGNEVRLRSHCINEVGEAHGNSTGRFRKHEKIFADWDNSASPFEPPDSFSTARMAPGTLVCRVQIQGRHGNTWPTSQNSRPVQLDEHPILD
jgi:hypothetical protein